MASEQRTEPGEDCADSGIHSRKGCDRFRLLQRIGFCIRGPEEAHFVRNG